MTSPAPTPTPRACLAEAIDSFLHERASKRDCIDNILAALSRAGFAVVPLAALEDLAKRMSNMATIQSIHWCGDLRAIMDSARAAAASAEGAKP